MSHSREDSDPVVRQLREQIRGLEDQLQRLVRTEQRLYFAQREVGWQLRQVEALNAFSVEAARCRSEGELIQKALATFFSLFAYEQAIAFLRGEDGRLEATVTHHVKGRAGSALDSGSRQIMAGPSPVPGESLLMMSGDLSEQPAAVREAVTLFERIFGPSESAATRHLLPLRDGVDAPSLGFLVLRRQGQLAFHEHLAREEDRPFLELFGRHVASALTQFRLMEELRQTCARLAAAKEEAVRHERLAAVGQLAAVVAHEVRNPVAVIFNSVAGIRSGFTADGQKNELLTVISEEATRLDAMVADLLDFARPNLPLLKPERLDQVVRVAVERALGAYPERGPEVLIEVDPRTPSALGDARMLHQAVLNLLTNSLQASCLGEKVLVRLGREERGKVLLASLEVVDRGTGIAESDLERVFEPFFTTKAQGSGLGLAVVKKVVEAHRGELRVSSRPGEGSAFKMLIPAVDAAS